LGSLSVTFTVAFFLGMNFQPAKVFPKCITHQGRTIPIGSARGSIGSLKELLVKYDLDCFHTVESVPHYTT